MNHPLVSVWNEKSNTHEPVVKQNPWNMLFCAIGGPCPNLSGTTDSFITFFAISMSSSSCWVSKPIYYVKALKIFNWMGVLLYSVIANLGILASSWELNGTSWYFWVLPFQTTDMVTKRLTLPSKMHSKAAHHREGWSRILSLTCQRENWYDLLHRHPVYIQE